MTESLTCKIFDKDYIILLQIVYYDDEGWLCVCAFFWCFLFKWNLFISRRFTELPPVWSTEAITANHKRVPGCYLKRHILFLFGTSVTIFSGMWFEAMSWKFVKRNVRSSNVLRFIIGPESCSKSLMRFLRMLIKDLCSSATQSFAPQGKSIFV